MAENANTLFPFASFVPVIKIGVVIDGVSEPTKFPVPVCPANEVLTLF